MDSLRRILAQVSKRTHADLDAEAEFAKFVAHHRAEGKRSASWPDSWRAWLERSATFAVRDGRTVEPPPEPWKAPPKPDVSATPEQIDQAVEAVRALAPDPHRRALDALGALDGAALEARRAEILRRVQEVAE